MTAKVKELVAQGKDVSAEVLAWEIVRGLGAEVSYFRDDETGKLYRPKPGVAFYEDEPGKDVLDCFLEVEEPKMATAGDYLETLDLLVEMGEAGFDWVSYLDNNYYEGMDAEFQSMIAPHPGAEYGDWVACGSYKLARQDAALMFYRIIWLVQPKHVDFSDMYKTDLFSFATLDGRYLCEVSLFKYEPAIYFYAIPEAIEQPEDTPDFGFRVSSGIPGLMKGATPDATGRKFFDVVKKLVSQIHTIYAGNDFEV